MKGKVKKNQLIIVALAVMIAAAGYLNYTGRLFGENAKGTKEANADLTNQELLDISQEDTEAGSEDIESNDSETEGTPGEAVLTNGSAQTTVAQAKVTREQVRAQNKETLQSIIDNTELSEEEKSDAVAQMVELTKQSETEMEIETLMATKGFSEAVVSLGEDSADVVVNAEELKENLEDDTTGKTSKVYKYLYYFLQVLEDVPEIKYMLGYVAKTTGFISPDEFIFEEDEQFAFESIMYSAMVLYNSKSASKEKLLEMHKKFTKEIEAKHEEKLSRTQDLITDKDQALKELGYAELNESNYSEVLEKIAEIQSRKI